MNNFKQSDISTFKKGKYIIGDLCYLFRDKDWEYFCETADLMEDILEYKGVPLYIHSTDGGDGLFSYTCNKKDIVYEGTEMDFPVDAGLIGIISVDVLNKLNIDINDFVDKNSNKSYTSLKIIDIKKDFQPSYNNGTYDLETIKIFTGEEDVRTLQLNKDDKKIIDENLKIFKKEFNSTFNEIKKIKENSKRNLEEYSINFGF